jgi:hypothetical protein
MIARIEYLLVKYYEAETSVLEEQELMNYFDQPDVDDSLIKYRDEFRSLSLYKTWDVELDLTYKPKQRVIPASVKLAKYAAAAAIVSVISLIFFRKFSNTQDAIVAANVKQSFFTTSFFKKSWSDKLSAMSSGNNFTPADTSGLIKLIREDPEINVRLKAIQLLARLAKGDTLNRMLLKVMPDQQDIVQIEIFDQASLTEVSVNGFSSMIAERRVTPTTAQYMNSVLTSN